MRKAMEDAGIGNKTERDNELRVYFLLCFKSRVADTVRGVTGKARGKDERSGEEEVRKGKGKGRETEKAVCC